MVMKFCADTRRGADEMEMTELMLETFHSYVKDDDILVLAGDISFGGVGKVRDFVSRLPGKKMLAGGNHDDIIFKKEDIYQMFDKVRGTLHLKVGEHRFNISHEPKAEWVDCHKGVIHLHGHLHGNTTNTQWQQQYKMMDIGIDARPDNEMRPWHLDEILFKMKDRGIMSHHDDTEE
jgi:calcineurin-like phosphoesterase family protein